MQAHFSPSSCSYTHLDWVMMGCRVLFGAKIVGYDMDGEELYSGDDVVKDDEDI